MPKRAASETKLKAFDLKAAREAVKMTQSQVGELLSVTQVSVARWERDGNMPSIYRKYWGLYWETHGKTKPKRH